LLHTLAFTVCLSTDIYTLSLHDALPISDEAGLDRIPWRWPRVGVVVRLEVVLDRREDQPAFLVDEYLPDLDDAGVRPRNLRGVRSEEHTSELQSHLNLVCRLLLEKKKTK